MRDRGLGANQQRSGWHQLCLVSQLIKCKEFGYDQSYQRSRGGKQEGFGGRRCPSFSRKRP
ncbi:hypothetical protein BCAR13_1090045 [Paraburkholderia caribensis]|nr:hypothetical protein BCAR13_1090045 [Paraburkholderia caribensis]